MIVDTHAHLDQPDFDADRDDVVRRAQEAGLEAIVCIGLDVPSSKATISLAERYPIVWAAIGVHPHYAGTLNRNALEEMRAMASHPKVVAVGETGLDYYRMKAPREVQLRAFQSQLALAGDLGLPVVIHDRDAHEEVMRILGKWAGSRPRKEGTMGALHCFSGDVALAREAISYGFMISIAGPVTFPKADRLAELVRGVSPSTLITETDCPFLAPQQFRGKRNEPAYVKFVVETIAKLRSETVDVVAKATSDNARRLFKLDLKEGHRP